MQVCRDSMTLSTNMLSLSWVAELPYTAVLFCVKESIICQEKEWKNSFKNVEAWRVEKYMRLDSRRKLDSWRKLDSNLLNTLLPWNQHKLRYRSFLETLSDDMEIDLSDIERDACFGQVDCRWGFHQFSSCCYAVVEEGLYMNLTLINWASLWGWIAGNSIHNSCCSRWNHGAKLSKPCNLSSSRSEKRIRVFIATSFLCCLKSEDE
jgi:hypothetical protein